MFLFAKRQRSRQGSERSVILEAQSNRSHGPRQFCGRLEHWTRIRIVAGERLIENRIDREEPGAIVPLDDWTNLAAPTGVIVNGRQIRNLEIDP